MTPFELEILLHYYYCEGKDDKPDTELRSKTIEHFKTHNILDFCIRKKSYVLTNKGKAWIKATLRTPIPREVYVDQLDNIIEVD